jgi:AcrR family transcriptional regulator
MGDAMKGARHRHARNTTSKVGEPERADRRTEIREKATQVFLKYGYKKTTIEDIGKACGLGKAALYYYYSGKEDLFAEIVRAASEQVLAKMQAAVDATDDPRARFLGLVKTRMQAIREAFLGTAVAEELDELLPAAHLLRRDYFEKEVQLVQRVLADGVRRRVFRQLEPHAVASLIMTAMKGLELHFRDLSAESSSDEGLEAMLNLFLDGICR